MISYLNQKVNHCKSVTIRDTIQNMDQWLYFVFDTGLKADIAIHDDKHTAEDHTANLNEEAASWSGKRPYVVQKRLLDTHLNNGTQNE